MEVIGYVGALLMGATLGIMGGGGSILTVPILVYLFMIDAALATTYSLFVVGFTSLVGAIERVKTNQIHWPMALYFGLPSVLSVYLTRLFLLPRIPTVVYESGDFVLTKSMFVLVLFAGIMLLASVSMIRKPTVSDTRTKFLTLAQRIPLMLMRGLALGCITGLVGAGGGFLIIPALVLMAGLSMRDAIGTSLIIVAMNSLVGFMSDFSTHALLDWRFLLFFTTAAVAGILFGSAFSQRITNERLRPAFGYFVLLMGCYILVRELFLNH